MRPWTRWRILGIVLLYTAVALGCASSSEVLEPANAGQLTVRVHDAPAPWIAEAHVTVGALELRDAATGVWVPVDLGGAPTIELTVLVNGNMATIASSPIPAGRYDAMRVTLERARVVLTDGSEVSFEGPFAVAVEGFPEILVEEGGAVTVTLDFPVDLAFQLRDGTVVFAPTVRYDPGS